MNGLPEKIIVAGFSGAGKSTLAAGLGRELGLPVVSIDSLCFDENWMRLPVGEVSAVMDEVCSGDRWVIDQLYLDVAADHIWKADLLVFIEIGLLKNTYNVVKRKIKRILRPRGRTGEGGNKRLHFNNIRRIWHGRKGYLQSFDALIDANRDSLRVIRVRGVNERTLSRVIGKIKGI